MSTIYEVFPMQIQPGTDDSDNTEILETINLRKTTISSSIPEQIFQ